MKKRIFQINKPHIVFYWDCQIMIDIRLLVTFCVCSDNQLIWGQTVSQSSNELLLVKPAKIRWQMIKNVQNLTFLSHRIIWCRKTQNIIQNAKWCISQISSRTEISRACASFPKYHEMNFVLFRNCCCFNAYNSKLFRNCRPNIRAKSEIVLFSLYIVLTQ